MKSVPWHFWLVVLVALFFSVSLAYDYWFLMMATPTAETAEVQAGARDAQVGQQLLISISYITATLGGVMLALRRRWSMTLYFVGLFSLFANILIFEVIIGKGIALGSRGFLLVMSVFAIQMALLLVYSLWARRRGWIK